MALWDNKQYDVRATEIASAFATGRDQGGASLNDLVEKTAREEGLVPEQVRRLARAANLQAWKVEFDRMKVASSPDRNVEFALCDENEVLGRLNIAGQAAVKEACFGGTSPAQFPELPNDMYELRHPSLPEPAPIAKTASELVAPLRVRVDMEVLKLRRLEDELSIRAKTACERWRESLQEVIEDARRVTWTAESTADLEKSAMALHGLDVLPEINALRKLRNESPLVVPTTKLAALQDRIDASETKQTSLLKKAADARIEFRQLEAAQVLAMQKRTYFESRLRGAT